MKCLKIYLQTLPCKENHANMLIFGILRHALRYRNLQPCFGKATCKPCLANLSLRT